MINDIELNQLGRELLPVWELLPYSFSYITNVDVMESNQLCQELHL